MDLLTLTLIGTIAAVILVLLTISQMQLQKAGISPKLLVTIDYTPGSEPLEVQNVEGPGAYQIRLDKFATDLAFGDKRKRFYCKFETIDHLRAGQSARIQGVLEDPRGEHEINRMALEALHARSGFATGLVLRLHYRDGAGMRYVVHVQMPILNLQDRTPRPANLFSARPALTWLTAPVEIVRWSLLVASTLIRIRRERSTTGGMAH